MTTFVDSSALYALLDENDEEHRSALSWFGWAVESAEALITHNYVVVEVSALVQHRLGDGAVRRLVEDLQPSVLVHFVGEVLHHRAVSVHLGRLRRRLSLIDAVSFEFMRESGIDTAFAFDRDFAREGFTVVPS